MIRKSFHIFITLLVPFLVLSQSTYDRETYLDSLSIETDFEHAFYTRIIKNYETIQNEYLYTDYYKSGQVYMKGKSKNRDYLLKTGQFVYYFENGKRKQIINYDESIPKGNFYSWYDSGEKKVVGEYLINDKEERQVGILRIDQFWDENCNQKVIDGYGFYEEDEDKTVSNGKLVSGLKDSVWTGSDKKIHINFTEEYKNGNLIFGTSIDSLGTSYHYKEVTIKPKPKNGVERFYQYIARNFKMPYDVSNAKGKILLSFVIEKDGKIGDVKVVKSVHPKLDSEAVRLLYNCPLWEPGTSRGKLCRVKYTLPITISGP